MKIVIEDIHQVQMVENNRMLEIDNLVFQYDKKIQLDKHKMDLIKKEKTII